MKLRIIKKNNAYYPQYRWAFMWFHFTEGYCDSWAEYYKLSEAEEYIKNYITRTKPSRSFEVVKVYNVSEEALATGGMP